MARGLNKVLLIGYLGRDPEVKTLPSGVPLATCSVAVSRAWRTPEGDLREETEWFRVIAWRSLAETAQQFLRKGSRVYIEGRLRTRRWQDNEGQEHTTTEVEALDLLLLDARPTPLDDAPLPSETEMPGAEDAPF